jgi:DMSO/TMAO reductase YedYZ molybdopterin-dependent catalytic subunit
LLYRETVTPTDLFFVRTHGSVPEVDPSSYHLTVDGLVREPCTLSLEDLRRSSGSRSRPRSSARASTQSESAAGRWNVQVHLNNAWHRVGVTEAR